VINVNAVSGAYQVRQQSNFTPIELRPIFAEWSDITQAALLQFFMLAENVFSYCLPMATRLEQAKSAQHVIEEFGRLKENWDGYGASPIGEQGREYARHFINVIEASPFGLPAPEICPKPNGTISLEWETPHTEVYIEIGNTRYSGFIKSGQQQVTFLQGRANTLDQQIVALIHSAISASATPSASTTEIHTQTRQHEHVAA
jgi:hypothetical protein